MNLQIDLTLDPAAIRPALQALENYAERIAAIYQGLKSLLPADPPVAAPAPPARPVNGRKVEPRRSAPTKIAPVPKAPTVDVSAIAKRAEQTKRAAPTKRDDRILALVVAHHGLTCTELGQKLGVPVPNIYGSLQRLVRDRRLTVDGDKKYRTVVDADSTEGVN